MSRLTVCLFALLMSSTALLANGSCPHIGADTSCGILIVITDQGISVQQDPTQGPFDGVEDTLVGVQNNSSKRVMSLPLTASQAIFSFDGDGLCAFVTCTWPHPYSYEGPITNFSSINAAGTSGIVNFVGGLAAGDFTYFSLELSISTICQPLTVAPLLKQNSGAWTLDTYDHLYVTKTFANADAVVVTNNPTIELAIIPNSVGQPANQGATTQAIMLTTKTLNGIRDAINSVGVTGVTASVLNKQVNNTTRYYLSLTVNIAGTNTLQLRTTAGAPTSNILRNISAKGCYLTSTAMLINYRAGNQQVTDPRALNNWLNSQVDGYIGAGNLNPVAVARYARNVVNVGMWFQPSTGNQRDDFALNNYLCTGNPAVLRVAGSPDHFVVATGQTVVNGQNSYFINDPYYAAVTLADPRYNNSYKDLRLFSSTSTPPNALVVSAHSPVELLLTDSSGNRTGYDPTTGGTVQQIPGSGYSRESIGDDDDPVNEPPTDETKSLEAIGVASGLYKFQVIGVGTGPFTIDVLAYDSSGTPQIQSFTGTATQGSADVYNITYSSTPGVPLVVVPADDILLPPNVTVGPGQCVPLPLSLTSPSGPIGTFITLTSSDPSKVTLGPGNLSSETVFIPAGAITGARTPLVCGVNFGTATISATGGGLPSANQTVLVSATLSFSPSNSAITRGKQDRLTLSLSAPAPVGGVTVSLNSDQPSVATVPSSVTILAGTSSVIVPITGIAVGSTVIHASSLPNVPETTASVTVQ
uniref:Peptidase C39-like domain-containing protein n=1 Tax=Solibacter usitatus (strain Ellin6076) TaxID=234267 RepID=Q01P83_SOLUE